MLIESIEHLGSYGINLVINDGEQSIELGLVVNIHGGVSMTDIDEISDNLSDREYDALDDLMSALASILLA
ncbi:hypothetical protein ACWOAH_10375 [Vagococcus vulneris]|uniref:Uncharacterized protein n=2 Tax=Vagococcus vulneris TaxID=1977869 RepID=A0A429ZTA6_9ENTE|nr:hypothetical protein CBF37_10425 [Vagococcus vulneris]